MSSISESEEGSLDVDALASEMLVAEVEAEADAGAEADAVSGDSGERRRDARTPIELRVEYKRLNTFFHDYTKNISKGGTFIKTDRPLEIGTLFLFRLILPAPEEPLTIRGDVRWVVREGEAPPPESNGSNEPGMGIRFVYDDPEERFALERRVERLMTGSLGPLIYGRLFHDRSGSGGR
jgi:type IV pilus assembly protein PilZ